MIALLDQIFLVIYHLSLQELIACCAVGTMGFYALHRRYAHRQWWRMGSVILLALWAAVVVCATVLGREGGKSTIFQIIPFHSYRQVPMGRNSEILRSNVMNLALFYPAGVLVFGLLPRHRTFGRKLACTVLVFSLFSLTIELAQFTFGLGLGEIDDVLHNTLGATLGFSAISLGDRIHSAKQKDDERTSRQHCL